MTVHGSVIHSRPWMRDWCRVVWLQAGGLSPLLWPSPGAQQRLSGGEADRVPLGFQTEFLWINFWWRLGSSEFKPSPVDKKMQCGCFSSMEQGLSFLIWFLSHPNLLKPSRVPGRLRDTGQGINGICLGTLVTDYSQSGFSHSASSGSHHKYLLRGFHLSVIGNKSSLPTETSLIWFIWLITEMFRLFFQVFI